MNESTAVCTIVAKNYLPFARVLARSLHEHHPGLKLVTLLADEADGYFEPRGEPFEVLPLAELSIPNMKDVLFRSTRFEASVAPKPYLLRRLLERASTVVFVDPDAIVLGDLEPLFADARAHAVTLVPHALTPASLRHDLRLHRAGAYNGGVIGVSRSDETFAFLDWWAARMHRWCTYDPARGLHYDQRWLDLAPALFAGVHLHRDRGTNVAYWNLHERADARWRIFHFSGFAPDRPDAPTLYAPDLTMRDVPQAASHLFADYAHALNTAGWRETRDWPYAYATFDNGVPIPEVARRLYSELDGRERFGDPFATGSGSYFQWLTTDAGRERLWSHVHARRPDLQAAFRHPRGRRFRAWRRRHGAREYSLPSEFA